MIKIEHYKIEKVYKNTMIEQEHKYKVYKMTILMIIIMNKIMMNIQVQVSTQQKNNKIIYKINKNNKNTKSHYHSTKYLKNHKTKPKNILKLNTNRIQITYNRQ